MVDLKDLKLMESKIYLFRFSTALVMPIRERMQAFLYFYLYIYLFTLQDSQLDHFAPFSWTDFVEYMRVQRSGRRRSTRRVSFFAFATWQVCTSCALLDFPCCLLGRRCIYSLSRRRVRVVFFAIAMGQFCTHVLSKFWLVFFAVVARPIRIFCHSS
jgi:hypothetical protein